MIKSSKTGELTLRPVLFLKTGKRLTFAEAQAQAWQGVKIRPCRKSQPAAAGYGVFTNAGWMAGDCLAAFVHLKDAVADIDARQA